MAQRNPKNIVAASRETPAAVFAFDRKAMLHDVLNDSTRIRCVAHIGENGVRHYQAG